MDITITQAELNKGGKQLELFGKLFAKNKDSRAIAALKKEIKELKESVSKYDEKVKSKLSKTFFDAKGYQPYQSNWAALLKGRDESVKYFSSFGNYENQTAICAIRDASAKKAVLDSYNDYFTKNITRFNALGQSRFLGYPFLSSLTQDEMMSLGIRTISDELVREWGEVKSVNEQSDDDNIAIINKTLDKLKAAIVFKTAAYNTGFFGGCLVYIDIVEDKTWIEPSDAEKETPLFKDDDPDFNIAKLKPWRVKGLVPVEPINIAPGHFNSTDPLRSDFYQPEHFFILGKKVHRSRFLYFTDIPAPQFLKPVYMFFGIPLAQLALDFITDFYSNKDSVSRIVKKFSLLIFGTDAMNMLNSETGLQDRIGSIAKQRDNDSIVIMDKANGEEMQQINTPLSGLKEIWYANLEMLPIVFGLTKTKMLQTTPGGLNSTGEFDSDSFHEAINTKQKNIFGEPIKRLIDVICYSKGIDPNDMEFKFNSLEKMSDKEKAELNQTKANTDKTYYELGVISNVDIAKRIAGDEDSEYGGIDIPQEVKYGGQESEEDINDFLTQQEALDAEFEEGKHPRDDDGKFASGRAANPAETPKEISNAIRRQMTFKAIKESVPPEVRKKMENVNINFDKDNVLPELNEQDIKDLGAKSIKVRLKRGIINRQDIKHGDVKDNDVNMLIATALYAPDIKAQGKGAGYMTFVKRIGNNDNSLVLIDLKESKDEATKEDYYDIVHYYFVNDDRRVKTVGS